MSLATFLNDHKDILSLTANNRVKCTVTGHEMPPSLEIVEKYVKSRRKLWQKQKEWYSHDFSVYLPHIVPHKSDPNKKLFCNLTRTILNKIPDEVERHVKGKKYQRYDSRSSIITPS